MKKITKRLFSLLLAGAMIFSLTACSKGKSGGSSDVIKLDNFEILYKSACIMQDFEGKDAIVLTLDFTNKSDKSAIYVWDIDETAVQNGEELEITSLYTGTDTYEEVISGQFEEVAPGKTLELRTAFVLKDTTNKVEVTFSQFLGDKSGTITIDPSKLNRED